MSIEDQDAINRIYNKQHYCFVYFSTKRDQDLAPIRPIAKGYNYPDIAFITAIKGNPQADSFADYVGVPRWPSLFAVKVDGNYAEKYLYNGPWTELAIKKWSEKFVNNAFTENDRFYKSQGYGNNGGAVQLAVGSSFSQLAQAVGSHRFVQIYAPWCQKSRNVRICFHGFLGWKKVFEDCEEIQRKEAEEFGLR